MEWRALVKASTVATVIDPFPSTPTIMMGNGDITPILDVSSKQIYQFFCGTKADIAQCQTKTNRQVFQYNH